MPFEVIQFVDSISATATVRLSLSDGPWRVLFEGTNVSPPSLRRAISNTLLTDGSLIPAAAYDNREVVLRLQIKVAGALASALEVQRLRKELDRVTNILRWQPDAALAPVYFKTFRAPDTIDAIDHGINVHSFSITIPAEPFSYGHKENISAAVVSNDPNAANGRYFDVTGIKGDVETPLRLSITGSAVASRQPLFAVRRRGTVSAMPFLLQAESMTQGTDTSVAAPTDATGGGASPSGAASNTSVTTFATNTMTPARLSTTAFPSSPSVDVRGTYRVFARVRAPSVSSWSIQLEHGIRAIRNTAKTATTSSNVFSMVDLGLVQIPEGVDPSTDGPGGLPLSVVGIPMKIYAQRLTGTGNLVWDYFLTVPADDSFLIASFGSTSPTSYVVDGTSKSLYALDASGRIADIAQTGFVGLGWPAVSPGVTNRIVYINDTTPNPTTSDPVATTVTINGSYWPRYLAVGTGS